MVDKPFQCLKGMFSGYVQAIGAGESLATANFQRARHSVVSSVYHRAYHVWTQRKTFKMEVLRKLENAIFRFGLPNTVSASFKCCSSIQYLAALQKLPDLDDAMIQFYLNAKSDFCSSTLWCSLDTRLHGSLKKIKLCVMVH